MRVIEWPAAAVNTSSQVTAARNPISGCCSDARRNARPRPSVCFLRYRREHIVNRVSTICGFVGELGLAVHIKNIQIINLEEREREREPLPLTFAFIG